MPSTINVAKRGQARFFKDDRGLLTVFEIACEISFEIKRIFVVHNVNGERGGHAHLNTDQVLFPVSGSMSVRTFNGDIWADYKLIKPSDFLFVPSMVYVELANFSEGASCVVLANTHYDQLNSLRTLNDFKSALLN